MITTKIDPKTVDFYEKKSEGNAVMIIDKRFDLACVWGDLLENYWFIKENDLVYALECELKSKPDCLTDFFGHYPTTNIEHIIACLLVCN